MGPILRFLLVLVLLAGPGLLPAAEPPGTAWLWSRLGEDLTRIAGEVDGRVGVYVRCLATGRTFSLRADDPFPAASTIKLPLLVELYRQSEGKSGASLADPYTLDARDLVEGSAILGHLQPGTRLTNRDLALFTVVVSDNSATNVLINRVGMERVNASLDALGFRQTRLRRRMMDFAAARKGLENLSTPRELAEIMALVHEGAALSATAKADLLRLLLAPKEGYLTRLLPEDLPVASKTGSLPGVRNDVGLVLLKGRPFVIAVMASHLRDERQGEAAIARIVRAAALALDVAAASSPEGRGLDPLQVR